MKIFVPTCPSFSPSHFHLPNSSQAFFFPCQHKKDSFVVFISSYFSLRHYLSTRKFCGDSLLSAWTPQRLLRNKDSPPFQSNKVFLKDLESIIWHQCVFQAGLSPPFRYKAYSLASMILGKNELVATVGKSVCK